MIFQTGLVFFGLGMIYFLVVLISESVTLFTKNSAVQAASYKNTQAATSLSIIGTMIMLLSAII